MGRAATVSVWLAVAVVLATVGAVCFPIADALDADPRVGVGTYSGGPTAAPPPAVLEPVKVAAGADSGRLAAQLEVVASPGGPVLGVVLDAVTGEELYRRGSGTATPASSMKVLSGVVALDVLGPDTRFVTSTWLSPEGTLVLHGEGDPLLTSAASTAYPFPASLTDLADQTVTELRARGLGTVALEYDASRFGEPGWNPAWSEIFAWSVAPVSALTVDHGRVDPASATRAEDPARLAADSFATLLTARGITVLTVDPARRARDAVQVAAVRSPTVATLVEQSLLYSDNDVAETLTWQVAVARGELATPTTAARALTAELRRLGLMDDGMVIVDGNGIASDNAVTPQSLAEAVRLALTEDRLRAVATGLPVAGATGTLRNRFTEADAAAGRGLIRGKTGTLRGVNTLTGYVITQEGQALVFSFLVSGVGQDTGRLWLDETAAALAACGC
ncbi:MAG: D-alanyl-D-alanine carboxypeptidase/D-alanyl-D-alanine-endopeptidase [Propioniciclava sp.]